MRRSSQVAMTAFLWTFAIVAVAQEKPAESKPDQAKSQEASSTDKTEPKALKVDAEALKRVSHDIRYLAADEMEGRGVQTKGIKVAADYIREEFKKAGLESGTTDGSYFQYFDVPLREQTTTEGSTVVLSMGDATSELKLSDDFQMMAFGGNGNCEAEIVFVGYGITAPDLDYDDYADIDCKGKIVMMLRREPQLDDEDSKFNGKKTTRHSYAAEKIVLASKAGATGVLFVNDPSTEPDEVLPSDNYGSISPVKLPFMHITQAAADKLIAKAPLRAGDKTLSSVKEIQEHIDAEFKPVSQPLKSCSAKLVSSRSIKRVKAWNVIGVVEGEGPLADETVVVGAHYDHLGFGGPGSRVRGSTEVHNGADDNATGTAAVLELARRFAKAEKKPARRMVFIAFSGEERGLVGSAHYVDNPTYPLDKTIAMLNFDMIGNLRENQGVTLGGYGTGSGLQPVAEAAAEAITAKVRVSSGAGGGSDHLNFFRKRVPVMFCNTGLTKIYHTPDDDYETLNLPGAVMVVDLCEELLKGVVAMEERPTFTAIRSRRPRRPTVFLGVGHRVAEDEEGDGIVLTRIVPDTPAAKAGLKVGDRVTSIGDKKIQASTDLQGALRSKKPGDKITLGVVRDGEELTLEATLSGPPQRRRPARSGSPRSAAP